MSTGALLEFQNRAPVDIPYRAPVDIAYRIQGTRGHTRDMVFATKIPKQGGEDP